MRRARARAPAVPFVRAGDDDALVGQDLEDAAEDLVLRAAVLGLQLAGILGPEFVRQRQGDVRLVVAVELQEDERVARLALPERRVQGHLGAGAWLRTRAHGARLTTSRTCTSSGRGSRNSLRMLVYAIL